MSFGSSLVGLGSVNSRIPFQESVNMLKPKDSQNHPILQSLYMSPVNYSVLHTHTHTTYSDSFGMPKMPTKSNG